MKAIIVLWIKLVTYCYFLIMSSGVMLVQLVLCPYHTWGDAVIWFVVLSIG